MPDGRDVGVTVRADTGGFRADVEQADRTILQPRERRLDQLRRRLAEQQKRVALLQQSVRQVQNSIRGQAVTTGATIAFSQVAAGLGLDQSLIGRLGASIATGALAGAPGGLAGAGLGALVSSVVVLTGELFTKIGALFKRTEKVEEDLEAERVARLAREANLREQMDRLNQRLEFDLDQKREAVRDELEGLSHRTALSVPALQLR